MGENMKKQKFICSFLLILISGTSSMLFAKGTESKIEDKTFNESDFEVMNALQFTKIMGNGINLGNTMGVIMNKLKLNNWKNLDFGNPISGNVFCADPTAVEFEDRLYVYGTNDHEQYLTTEKKYL